MKRVKAGDVKPPPVTHIRANNASKKARTELKRRHIKTNGKDHRKAFQLFLYVESEIEQIICIKAM